MISQTKAQLFLAWLAAGYGPDEGIIFEHPGASSKSNHLQASQLE